MNKIAVLYIRVSYSEQVQGFSLESQERECRQWCGRNGYTVAKVFREDGITAKSRDKRLAFEDAIRYVEKAKSPPAAFVVINSDRFARNALDHLMVKELLARRDCRLVSVSENFEDSIWGRFFETVKAGLNQAENEERGHKTKLGMAEACRQGYWPWQPPVGYLRHWTADEKPSLKPDPVMAPILKKAFHIYASGNYTQKDILDRANEAGLRTQKGKRVSHQRFRKLLANPLYAGIVSSSLLEEDAQGRFEPLIDLDTFNIVQGQISSCQSGVPHIAFRQEFPLRGFVICGNCGKPMRSSWSTGRHDKKYPYYHCPPCSRQSLRAEKMEDAFADFLIANIRIDPDYAKAIREIILRQYRQETQDMESEATAKKKAREEAERKRDRLEELLIDGRIEPETYDRQMKNIKGDLALAIMAERDAHDEIIISEAALDSTLRFLVEPGEEWRKASTAMKMEIQNLLFDNGLPWTKKDGFGTAIINNAVNDLRSINGVDPSLAYSRGGDWKHILRFIDKIGEIYGRAAA